MRPKSVEIRIEYRPIIKQWAAFASIQGSHFSTAAETGEKAAANLFFTAGVTLKWGTFAYKREVLRDKIIYHISEKE